MAETFIHEGPLTSPPTHSSSPGLRFLAAFVPTLDSLSPPPTCSSLAGFVHSSAHVIMNGGSAIPLSNMLPMFEQRAKKLTMFQHEISRAWDIVAARGKRTVIYESFSVTVFKDDVEGMKVQILELNIAELEPMDGGVEGLGVVELRVFMDGSPVVRRMGEVKDACLEAFGWSRVDALVLTFHVGSRMK